MKRNYGPGDPSFRYAAFGMTTCRRYWRGFLGGKAASPPFLPKIPSLHTSANVIPTRSEESLGQLLVSSSLKLSKLSFVDFIPGNRGLKVEMTNVNIAQARVRKRAPAHPDCQWIAKDVIGKRSEEPKRLRR